MPIGNVSLRLHLQRLELPVSRILQLNALGGMTWREDGVAVFDFTKLQERTAHMSISEVEHSFFF